MASPPNNGFRTTKGNNSYFFYGTHPLKVPNHIIHANSANQLVSTTDQYSNHLSLNLKNNSPPSSAPPTTQSLCNFRQNSRDDEEMSEVNKF